MSRDPTAVGGAGSHGVERAAASRAPPLTTHRRVTVTTQRRRPTSDGALTE